MLRPNQKWMIALLAVLLVFQTIALSSRVVSTSLYFDTNGKLVGFIESQVRQMNETSEVTQFRLDEVYIYRNSSFTTQQAGIPYGNVVGIYLTTSIDLFFTLSNLLIIMVIMCFVPTSSSQLSEKPMELSPLPTPNTLCAFLTYPQPCCRLVSSLRS